MSLEQTVEQSPRSFETTESMQAFIAKAVDFAHQKYDQNDLNDAWNAFRVWLTPLIDYESEDWQLFLAWYVFHWQPATLENGVRKKRASVAELYLQNNEHSAEARTLVQSALSTPLDFYEIHELPEHNCYYVKSLFLGFQHSFAFTALPKDLVVGSVFLGKVVHLHDDRGIIVGHSRAFSKNAKVDISYVRRQLIKNRQAQFIEDFSQFDSDVFNLYHDLLHEHTEAH